MKTTLACRHCQYYSPEGRRGGVCQKLMTPVESNWKACSLALPPFAAYRENRNSIVMWHQKIDETLEVVLPLKPTANNIRQLSNTVRVASYEQ
ncbi:hypothetical protein [Hydrocoleum sp. CS-953]|uniref:hypothetical protein n=1 Tax=Microcoleaceae TaxID=1892252 RepID=UPI000B9C542D|nr:hypothetical protein [Hydrocoleum sp. CS-953]OZH55611.1 hypothetical protein AFK68_03490 [Hydrocoleum sp. CS-953]